MHTRDQNVMSLISKSNSVNMSLICTQKIIHSVMWTCLLYAHKRSFIHSFQKIMWTCLYMHTQKIRFHSVMWKCLLYATSFIPNICTCTQNIIHSVMWTWLLYAHKRSFIPQCAHVSYIHTKDQSFRKVNMSPICTQKIIHSVMWTCLLYAHKRSFIP